MQTATIFSASHNIANNILIQSVPLSLIVRKHDLIQIRGLHDKHLPSRWFGLMSNTNSGKNTGSINPEHQAWCKKKTFLAQVNSKNEGFACKKRASTILLSNTSSKSHHEAVVLHPMPGLKTPQASQCGGSTEP